ncbi:MAG: anthranilate phosphoribosyltransferase [Acidimicrobiales bacterium]
MSRPDLDEVGGWTSVLGALADGRDLTADQTHAALVDILSGGASDARIAGFIVALRLKGETVDEVTGMVDAMLDASEPLPIDIDPVDIVGTGGSASRRVHALNVSTMASFVAAGAGATVCKHGNRRASSTSGAFDLLDELGVVVDLHGDEVATCVREVGLGFAFARSFHPAMRFAGPVRAELGIPTVMNLLGPLSHPARTRRQVIGVGDPRSIDLVAGVLAARGAERSLVAHGHDGLDELTVTGPTDIRWVRDGEVVAETLDPVSLGLPHRTPDQLAGGSPATNADIARRVFAGEAGPVRDIVVLNAAAGLWVGGQADTLAHGIELAGAAIDDGRVSQTLERLVARTRAFRPQE